VHPLHARFAKISGASIPEPTVDQTLGEGIVSAAALLACTDEEIASAGYDAFGIFGLLSNKRLVVSIQAL
jgi:hypothetical protein